MKTARKKPVEIQFIQYTGGGYNLKDLQAFVGEALIEEDDVLKIRTLEGDMICNITDMIIKGVNGEFYPCKEDIFRKTYDIIL